MHLYSVFQESYKPLYICMLIVNMYDYVCGTGIFFYTCTATCMYMYMYIYTCAFMVQVSGPFTVVLMIVTLTTLSWSPSSDKQREYNCVYVCMYVHAGLGVVVEE